MVDDHVEPHVVLWRYQIGDAPGVPNFTITPRTPSSIENAGSALNSRVSSATIDRCGDQVEPCEEIAALLD
jgi:hypothetical protein